MDGDGATFRELLAYTDAETERWHAWLREQPAEVLRLPIGEGVRQTVGDVIGHIFSAELRYAERLLGRPVTAFEQLDTSSLDAMWRIRLLARGLFGTWLDGYAAGEREREITFDTRTLGPLTASAHKIAVHVFLHGIRHWAQISTTLRQAGHRQPWEHDWLLCDAVR
jgi:uncharacterized damage-inducible protein DinB